MVPIHGYAKMSMNILAVDTTTASCSTAVVGSDGPAAELTIQRRETHARHLMAMIRSVLETARMELGGLDGFAVTVGPGSFTGLRIGLSTVKGLALAAARPVVGVSSLEALARQTASDPRLICPLIDARKGEIYFAAYCWTQGRLQCVRPEQALEAERAVADLRQDCLFIGPGLEAYRNTIAGLLGRRACFAEGEANLLRAATVGRIALERFEAEAVDAADLQPRYLRKSDAELGFRKQKKSMTIPTYGRDGLDFPA